MGAKLMVSEYKGLRHARPPLSSIFQNTLGTEAPPIWWPSDHIECSKPGSCALPTTDGICHQKLSVAAAGLRTVTATNIVLGTAFPFQKESECSLRAPGYHPAIVTQITRLTQKVAPDGYDAIHLRLTEVFSKNVNETLARVKTWFQYNTIRRLPVFVATDNPVLAAEIIRRAAAAA